MSTHIRYQTGDANENAILRLALLEDWGGRCYWCHRPKDFTEIEIDHIIPHSITLDRLREVLQEHVPEQLHDGFDVHAIYNLAPICGTCNREKRDLNFRGAGIITAKLAKARQRSVRIEKRVRSFKSSNLVTKALLAVSMVELSDPGSMRALQDFSHLVIHRLAVLTPEALTEYSIDHEIQDPNDDQSTQIIASLGDISRRTRVILEDFYQIDFDETLLEIALSAKKATKERLSGDIEMEFRNLGHPYPDAGDPTGRLLIEITQLTYNATDTTFSAEVVFDADMSSGVLVHSDNDSGTDILQGDAAAHGRISIAFWVDETVPVRVETDEAVIEEWKKGPAPW